jgi:hypothetical protein
MFPMCRNKFYVFHWYFKYLFGKFKVCKSVHHRTIQLNHKSDATNFQFIILKFIYNSTCFGRFPAHHQKLNDCSGSLCFYLRIVVIQHHYHHDTKVKPEDATAVIDGRENARNILSGK